MMFAKKMSVIMLWMFTLSLLSMFLILAIRSVPVSAAPAQCYAASSLNPIDCDRNTGFSFADDKCYVEARNQRNDLTGYTEKTCQEVAETDARNTNRPSANGDSAILVDCEPLNNGDITADNCMIVRYLVTGINFLTAIAGMAIVFSIMYAGYQYMIARDNAGAISAAKTRIIWAIVALLMLIFTYTGLDFFVPGGVL